MQPNFRSWIPIAVGAVGVWVAMSAVAPVRAVGVDLASRLRIDVQGSASAPQPKPTAPDKPAAGPERQRVEPPARSSEEPAERGRQEEGQDSDGPGCPANQRQLELLV